MYKKRENEMIIEPNAVKKTRNMNDMNDQSSILRINNSRFIVNKQ